MDNTDYDEQVVTKSPTYTAKTSPNSALPVVATIAPFEIEKSPFQYVNAALSSSSSTPRTAPAYTFPFSYALPVVMTI